MNNEKLKSQLAFPCVAGLVRMKLEIVVLVVGQIEGKNLLYRGTIPFCLHIVP
jgi:hypothetical protein